MNVGRVRPAGGGFRRRARLVLILGGLAFLALASYLVFFRSTPAPYTPGTEAAESDEITRTLERTLPADVPRITFTDAAESAGIRFTQFHGRRSTQLPEDMGSGVAWGDYDNDGDPDLYFVNESGPLTDDPAAVAASPARAALYRNDGGGTFTDVTEAAGVAARGMGMGAAWGDFDGDGFLDLVVTRFGTILLYRNRGDGTFEDVSARAGVGKDEGFWTGASWSDYDRDGDLDLYVCGYVRYRFESELLGRTSLQYKAVVPFTLNPSTYPPERNLLFRNDGGRFREIARKAGVDNLTGRSLSAAWADFDGDGWPDLYVANDISDNAMYHNRGDGTFQDVSHSAWVADYRGAMGLAIGDWENDGDLDIFVTHWIAQENALYENQKGVMKTTPAEPMHFLDQADMNGLGQIALDYVGWGTEFLDYDNDGRLDLFVVNGSTFQRDDDPSRLVPMKNLLFWNAGRGRGFFEVDEVSGKTFVEPNVGRGAACADYDGDGDLDFAIVVNGGPARLLRNDAGEAKGGWLRVVLRGPAQGSVRGLASSGERPSAAGSRRVTTTFATGALVRVATGPLSQIREIGSGPSYLSQSPPGEAFFGLGDARTIDSLEVAWPDGTRQSFRDLPARSTITLTEGGEPKIAAGGGAAPEAARLDAKKAAVIRFWETFNAATGLRMKGDCAGATAAYRQALALDPRHEDSLYYLGQCLREQGSFREARDEFTRLVTINPSSARGHLALGALLASPDPAAPLDLEAAEEYLRKAHEINGEETGPMVRLGEVLIVKGDPEQARHWLEAANHTNAKSVDAAFLSGYLRWKAGDLQGAGAFYARTLRALETDAPVKGVLGEGDRKATQPGGAPPAGAPAAAPGGPTHIAAPPLKSPLGRTLFGDFTTRLREGTAHPLREPFSANDLRGVYEPVGRHVREIAGRAVPGTSIAISSDATSAPAGIASEAATRKENR